MVIDEQLAVVRAPERETVWKATVARLPTLLRRSTIASPPALGGCLQDYLSVDGRAELRSWMEMAGEAIKVRQAVLRHAFERAVEGNLRRLRGRIRTNPEMLTAEMLQAAIGKAPPRPCIWGIAGTVPVGVRVHIDPDVCPVGPAILEHLRAMASTRELQAVAGSNHHLELWFRGPRPLGNFLVEWSSELPGRVGRRIHLLDAPEDFVAVIPDDMLAMQELCLARQGMAPTAQCPTCGSQAIQPVVTAAPVPQQRGCPWRTVRYFCTGCQIVVDKVGYGADPPCPIPEEFWASLKKFPDDMQPFLSRPMDLTSLRARLRKLPKGRAAGRDGVPYEYLKFGPGLLHGYLLAAANAFFSGSHALPHTWLGGVVTMIPKVQGATAMKNFRPIANLLTAYKFCTAEVTNRMMRTFEEYGVWHGSQEGARRKRGTRRQIYKLIQILEEGKREQTVVVVAQLDFKSAFTSTSPKALYKVFEAYGVPQPDITLMKRMHTGSWYSVTNSFGETAACELENGMKQGDPPSPPSFISVGDPFLHMASASGMGWKPTGRVPMGVVPSRQDAAQLKERPASAPASMFVDDTGLAAKGRNAVSEMQALISLIEAWEPWSNIYLNLSKSFVIAFDFSQMVQVDTSQLLYRGSQLPVHPADQPFRYLGVLLTVTLDFKHEKERVMQETEARLGALAKAKFLSPMIRETAVKLGVVSVFRYSAGLVPWTFVELEELTAKWVAGFRAAWNMPTMDGSLFRLCQRYGGRGCPTAHEVWTTEAMSLISQCLGTGGVVAQLMVADLQRACLGRGCLSLFQLQRILRLVPPRGLKTWVERLVSKLDALGLDVGAELWNPPEDSLLLLSEVVWRRCWYDRRHKTESAQCGIEASGARDSLKALGTLAQHGVLYAAQLSVGEGRWLPRMLLPAAIPENEYQALVEALATCSQGARIDQERRLVPGRRQLSLQEAWAIEGTRAQPSVSALMRREDQRVGNGAGDVRYPRARLHPWQCDAPLPDRVIFDLATDASQSPIAVPGWGFIQRNGRLIMQSPTGALGQLEAAQAHMLRRLNEGVPAQDFYAAILTACTDQQHQDNVRSVLWSRHLLACIVHITKAKGVVGCRSVLYHPHFQWFQSPLASDTALGSVLNWPEECCVLLLDAYPGDEREAIIRCAMGHRKHVWVLRMVDRAEESSADHRCLVRCGAQLYARLPRSNLTVHKPGSWAVAQFDAQPAEGTTEIWRLGRASMDEMYLSRRAFETALGEWKHRREDFHWPAHDCPVSWRYYRESQQDMDMLTWEGVVAAVDGSVDRTRERMGAGMVIGKGPQPEFSRSFPVGGPLSSLLPEAAALHEVVSVVPDDSPLLIFVDCLVLLVILARWGQEDFWPDPEDIKHFDIVAPSLQLLRKRTAVTKLVKIKSHSGILLNERADELAELGCNCDEVPRWPGPLKLDPLCLCARSYIRESFAPFPDSNVADKVLVRKAVEGVERAASVLRGSVFAKGLLQDPTNCKTILEAIHSQSVSTIKLWMQAVADQYPTMARMHKLFPAKYRSPNCPWCGTNVPETLSHFASVCVAFHHARTAAHNQVWQIVTQELKRASPPGWQYFIETAMKDTGLLGNQGGSAPGMDELMVCSIARLGNLRPDAVAVNSQKRRIAILDLTRPYDGCDRTSDGEGSAQMSPSGNAVQVEGGCGSGATRYSGRNCNPVRNQPSASASTISEGRRSIQQAVERKIETYGALATGLRQRYGRLNWQVEILPWVVGVRGVVDAAGIHRALEFLDIPVQRRQALIRSTALASVQSFVFLHRVRQAANPKRILTTGVDQVRAAKRKRGEGVASTWQSWQRLCTDSMRIGLSQARWRGGRHLAS